MRTRVAVSLWVVLVVTPEATPVRASEAAPSEAAAGSVPPATSQATSAPTSAPTTAAARVKRTIPPPEFLRPVAFSVLCGWILVCLYCAAWAHRQSSIAANHKPIVNLLMLFTGPVGALGLVVVQRNPRLREQVEQLLGRLVGHKPAASVGAAAGASLELCTSDGAPLQSLGGRNAPARESLEIAKRIITEALQRRASDILIDPRVGESYLVRYRIDGILQEVARFPATQGAAIVNCLKVASQLDISEKRRPQDGAFIAKVSDREIKFRSATAGTLYGEKLALRVFDVQANLNDLDGLGMGSTAADRITKFMQRSDGMLLIAGPTGSGKTTTIYAALNLLAGTGRNIVTIEDPIEYPLEHASQTEVNVKAGVTFANGLRSILRQDPDVILVGEIRDAETAETALQASQTGHLVVSTIHSNDGPTALARLVDFGIEPFLISTGLSAVLSQRLVRVLCPDCKAAPKISPKLRREAARRQIALAKVSVPVGCSVCGGTGYMGRTGLFEMLPLSPKMGQLLTEKPSLARIQAQVQSENMITMRQRGIEKVLQGMTSVDEVVRVTT